MSSDGNVEPSKTPEPKSEEDEDVERDSRTTRCCSLRYRRDLRRAKKALKRLRREVNVTQSPLVWLWGYLETLTGKSTIMLTPFFWLSAA